MRDRAALGRPQFTLLVPGPSGDADTDTEESHTTLERAIPLLEDAAGGRVEGLIGKTRQQLRSVHFRRDRD